MEGPDARPHEPHLLLRLFDHEADPFEYNNLAHDPRYAEAVAAMRALLKGGR